MFDNIEVLCRAAACLSFTDGRKRYVGLSSAALSLDRPQEPHVEIWRSAEIPNLVFGTAVRPCPDLHPSVVYGIVYYDGDRRLARDWSPTEYLVFERRVDRSLVVVEDDTAALHGSDVICLSAGFVVRAVRSFQVGAERFTVLEDGDGNEFLIMGMVGQLCLAM